MLILGLVAELVLIHAKEWFLVSTVSVPWLPWLTLHGNEHVPRIRCARKDHLYVMTNRPPATMAPCPIS